MPFELASFHEAHLCARCGAAAGKHRATDGKCPANKPFPKYPVSVEKKRGFDAAQELFGKRLDKYWAERSTTFEPKR